MSFYFTFFRTLTYSLAFAFAIFALCSAAPQTQNKDEKKFAPSYCLRFKLNCQSEQKKKHVCCLYPLPGATIVIA
jgi:hypothetical protein